LSVRRRRQDPNSVTQRDRHAQLGNLPRVPYGRPLQRAFAGKCRVRRPGPLDPLLGDTTRGSQVAGWACLAESLDGPRAPDDDRHTSAATQIRVAQGPGAGADAGGPRHPVGAVA